MKKLLTILFIALPLFLGVLIFALPDRAVSENENRALVQKSEISSDFFHGKFQKDLENFLSDQFPFRDRLKAAQNELMLMLGKREIGGAYICEGFRLVQKTEPDEKKLIAYAKKTNALAEKTKLPVFVMLVPPAEASSAELLPAGAPVTDCEKLYSSLSACLGSTKLIPLELKPGDYYLTDHHWNYEGAYSAYVQWQKAHGRKAKSFEKQKFSTEFRGTLYSKVLSEKSPFDELCAPKLDFEPKVTADGKVISLYDMDALKTKDKYNVFEGGNHGIVTVEGGSGKGILLLLKDSFANSFVPFIADDYAKIVMVDERYTFEDPASLAEAFGADEIAVIREMTG